MRSYIENILSGKTALGEKSAKKNIRFSADEAARNALATACQKLHNDIKVSVELDNDKSLTAFISKLTSYAAKKGWNTDEKVQQGFAELRTPLGDAIIEQPDLLESKAGVAAMLRKHHQLATQEAARRRKEAVEDKDAKPPVVYKLKGYNLVELFHPEHLREEARIMGHCLGSVNYMALLERDLIAGTEEANSYMTYGIKIRNGDSRIFSLRPHQGKNRVTIEYDVTTKSIRQMEDRNKNIVEYSAYFNALSEALYRMGKEMDLSGGIDPLPPPREGHVFIRGCDGAVPYTRDINRAHIINGTICLDESMSREEVAELAACPHLYLVISDCSEDWLNANLPADIKAGLRYGNKEPLELNNIETAGSIVASNALGISFSKLRECRSLFIDKAIELDAPSLRTASTVHCSDAVIVNLAALEDVQVFKGCDQAFSLELPALKKANNITTKAKGSVSFPALQQVHNILARNATYLSCPTLTKARTIESAEIASVHLPSLEDCRYILLENVNELNLPSLKRAVDVKAKAAATVLMPALTRARDIFIGDATSIDLTSLEKARNIDVFCAIEAIMPSLKKAAFISATGATTVHLPVLEQATDISANSTVSLKLPALEIAEDIHARLATEVELPLLRQADLIKLIDAAEVRLPSLKRVNSIFANSAAVFHVPALEYADALEASNAIDVIIPPNAARFVYLLNYNKQAPRSNGPSGP